MCNASTDHRLIITLSTTSTVFIKRLISWMNVNKLKHHNLHTNCAVLSGGHMWISFLTEINYAIQPCQHWKETIPGWTKHGNHSDEEKLSIERDKHVWCHLHLGCLCTSNPFVNMYSFKVRVWNLHSIWSLLFLWWKLVCAFVCQVELPRKINLLIINGDVWRSSPLQYP